MNEREKFLAPISGDVPCGEMSPVPIGETVMMRKNKQTESDVPQAVAV